MQQPKELISLAGLGISSSHSHEELHTNQTNIPGRLGTAPSRQQTRSETEASAPAPRTKTAICCC